MGPHARFDGNLREHHHFTCLACGGIADVDGPLTEPHSRALVSRVALSGGFLKGSKSPDNLKEAFAGESQANRRYGKPAHVGT